ncbi:9-O-acetylesterase [Sphingobacterium sp. ML3W]|uniref:sialate O-acetylesterase n=1 Tax=Sphingobacterium sp. ML3W TaxID=1538644 RepID=UPI00249C945E|nr:sialate O-acetylesterase [Sphingobacterium sp. ML3W]WFA82122.1 9-O-acetylesterase [Sphingobacterium sp. ML3W]
MIIKQIPIFFAFFLQAFLLKAQLKLPAIFGDNMILQRDIPIKLWGWAEKNETVHVQFMQQHLKTKADNNGQWHMTLAPTPHGGPYRMEIKGHDQHISLKNILVGEVWLASGQSNMEWTVKNSNNAASEISHATYPSIRAFNVEKSISDIPKQDLKGKWEVCSPATVGDFSAVGYFFSLKLYQELGIPVGIINASWGGTGAETWTSGGSFNKLPAHFRAPYQQTFTGDLQHFIKDNESKKQKYLQALTKDPGIAAKWYTNNTGLSAWGKMNVPQLWESKLGDMNGIVWFKRSIYLPKGSAEKAGSIHLGTIDDDDICWINGVEVGETKGYTTSRSYTVPQAVLKDGENTITVKIMDTGGGGGFYGNPVHLYLEVEGEKFPLAGEWNYKEAVTTQQHDYKEVSPNMFPSLLFNAMINPIVPYTIKGVIWYQGENNAGQAYDYRTLFPNLIQDWRSHWNQEFPFYWVQLANYMAKEKSPEDSDWAKLRDAQTRTLRLAHTGQAVITDIGEADDIHPRNKQEVGRRLALIALAKDYGQKERVYSGPTFKSLVKADNKLVISFDATGGGLVVNNKYGYVEGFALAGADKKFVWARAHIEGNKIIVQADQIINPVFVRYAWSNNPDVNLFNKEGLPAVPFSNE